MVEPSVEQPNPVQQRKAARSSRATPPRGASPSDAWEPPSDFRAPHPAYLKWDYLSSALSSLVIFGIACGAVMWAYHAWDLSIFLALGVLNLLAAGLLFSTLWFPARNYSRYRYRVTGKVFEVRRGVIFHVSRLIPLNRIQHVDLTRGPLERLIGLASLQLHTAGREGDTINLPGLSPEEAMALRDHLIGIGGDDGI